MASRLILMPLPKVLLDCDPGHDDAFAIMLAARTTDLVGITTVSGNAPLAQVTRNALSLTELLGIQVPVCAGASGPLSAESLHAPEVHGDSGIGAVSLPAPRRALTSDDAVAFLIEQSSAYRDLWLVAVGPLTNVALAVQRDKGFAGRLAGISIMGGSTAGGNRTAAAEFNILADPEAADVVFASGANIRMCGLNLTHQVRSDQRWIDVLSAADTPLGTLSAALLSDVHVRLKALTGTDGAAMHDPCAVLAVTQPEWFDFVPRDVRVELHGRWTRGMTVVDERPGQRRTNVGVAYGVDARRAAASILQHAV